jgi:hypothetical protein
MMKSSPHLDSVKVTPYCNCSISSSLFALDVITFLSSAWAGAAVPTIAVVAAAATRASGARATRTKSRANMLATVCSNADSMSFFAKKK